MKIWMSALVVVGGIAWLSPSCAEAVAEMPPRQVLKAVECFNAADWGASQEQVADLFERPADGQDWVDFFPPTEGGTFLLNEHLTRLRNQQPAEGDFLFWNQVNIFGAEARVGFEFSDGQLQRGFLLFNKNEQGESSNGLRPRLRNLLNSEYGLADNDRAYLVWPGEAGSVAMEAFKVREFAEGTSFGIRQAGYLLLVYSAN